MKFSLHWSLLWVLRVTFGLVKFGIQLMYQGPQGDCTGPTWMVHCSLRKVCAVVIVAVSTAQVEEVYFQLLRSSMIRSDQRDISCTLSRWKVSWVERACLESGRVAKTKLEPPNRALNGKEAMTLSSLLPELPSSNVARCVRCESERQSALRKHLAWHAGMAPAPWRAWLSEAGWRCR
ncbi:hypothetical protein BCR34DRAFT_575777 [Clohesyomyces aquaticus]|uniref:C2H2-type domain-containing protein n=1 Tax=Clohesyomyces aquaticus TaxID=1231657 RepID=A0A1Y1YQT1_9PLEO|nr:hypothetical protein BCR34DRAFT_575777 [Clohesyomyces aquaticus]